MEMTTRELIEKCEEAIASKGSDAYVILVIPRTANRGRIRLTPHRGPIGKPLEWGKGFTIAQFNAKDVLLWFSTIDVKETEK